MFGAIEIGLCLVRASKACNGSIEWPLCGSDFAGFSDRPVRPTTERLERGNSHIDYPYVSYVAPQTAKIHTPITLGIRIRTKLLVLKSRKHRPRGFDSHRPLHFSLSGVLLRCLRTRLSSSSSSHSLDAATVHLIECVDRLLGRARSRWPHPSVIDRSGPWRTSAMWVST
jgi:hypothetical protein